MNHTEAVVARVLPHLSGGRPGEGDARAGLARAGSASAATAADASLDPDRNNSPLDNAEDDCVMFVPQFSGGRIDPFGGKRLQVQDMKRLEALERVMRDPVLMTLTIDRHGTKTERGFAGPGEAYEAAMAFVSRLLTERLGLTHWARVLEVQKAGWPHWHILVDLAEFKGSLTDLRRRCWALWRDRWQFGIVDVDRIRKSAVGYLANYVMKKWESVPEWMGESCKRFRIVGYSKSAGAVIRHALAIPTRAKRRARTTRRYRRTRTLYERLAASGLSTAVVLRLNGLTNYVGTLAANIRDLRVLAPMLPWLQRDAEDPSRLTADVAPLEIMKRRLNVLRSTLRRIGVTTYTQDQYDRRLRDWKCS